MKDKHRKYSCISIDPSHKSHNAPVPYAHVCTFLSQSGALWDVFLVHYGVCEMDLLFLDNENPSSWKTGTIIFRPEQNGKILQKIFLHAFNVLWRKFWLDLHQNYTFAALHSLLQCKLQWTWNYILSTLDFYSMSFSQSAPWILSYSLQWRHNECDDVSNHQPHDCLLFIQGQIKENIKALRHWPLCGEFTGHRWIPQTKGQ